MIDLDIPGFGAFSLKHLVIDYIGIFVIQKEGGSVRAFHRADVLATNALEALELLRNPGRLVATLRS